VDTIRISQDLSAENIGCPAIIVSANVIQYMNMLMLSIFPEECDAEQGNGSFTASDGSVYIGEYHQDTVSSKPHGFGTAYFSNGDHYEGEWKDGRPHGYGVLVNADGAQYEGDFCEGKLHGHGMRKLKNAERYEGGWRDGVPQGFGKMCYASGCEFEGEWINGSTHGKGTHRWPNGDRYEGEWRDNMPYGHGVWYSQLRACEVDWRKGEEFGKVTYSFSNMYTWWVEGQHAGSSSLVPPTTATMEPQSPFVEELGATPSETTAMEEIYQYGQPPVAEEPQSSTIRYTCPPVHLENMQDILEGGANYWNDARGKVEAQKRKHSSSKLEDALYVLLYSAHDTTQTQGNW